MAVFFSGFRLRNHAAFFQPYQTFYMDPKKPKEPPKEVQLCLFPEQEPEVQETQPEFPKERRPKEPPYVFYVPRDCQGKSDL
ncbi:MAG TPA: hypothetical protein VGN63_19600 [Flavisolibacter sp.]|jgi:hypothetical protein|nr:hypothetical protein [Flavisolibacter sp.]